MLDSHEPQDTHGSTQTSFFGTPLSGMDAVDTKLFMTYYLGYTNVTAIGALIVFLSMVAVPLLDVAWSVTVLLISV